MNLAVSPPELVAAIVDNGSRNRASKARKNVDLHSCAVCQGVFASKAELKKHVFKAKHCVDSQETTESYRVARERLRAHPNDENAMRDFRRGLLNVVRLEKFRRSAPPQDL